MKKVNALSSILLLAFVSSCSKQDGELRTKVAGLEEQVKTLETSVNDLKFRQELDELVRNSDSVAYLTPGTDGYSTVTMDLGRVTVSLDNVEAYANGSRVTLQFGNLMSATINGAKATIEWGSVDAKGQPINDSAKSRDVSFTQSLRAGAWTRVPVVLEGVPPTSLGFVRLRSITHTGISLSSR